MLRSMYGLVTDQKERIGAWVARQVDQTASWGSFYAMGAEHVETAEIVAGIVMNNYNGANATVHIAITRTGRHVVEMFRAMAQYAFVQCGLRRLTGLVPSNRPDILEFDKHLGFEEEFVMKHGNPDCDMVVLVMWPEKCRWLRT